MWGKTVVPDNNPSQAKNGFSSYMLVFFYDENFGITNWWSMKISKRLNFFWEEKLICPFESTYQLYLVQFNTELFFLKIFIWSKNGRNHPSLLNLKKKNIVYCVLIDLMKKL